MGQRIPEDMSAEEVQHIRGMIITGRKNIIKSVHFPGLGLASMFLGVRIFTYPLAFILCATYIIFAFLGKTFVDHAFWQYGATPIITAVIAMGVTAGSKEFFLAVDERSGVIRVRRPHYYAWYSFWENVISVMAGMFFSIARVLFGVIACVLGLAFVTRPAFVSPYVSDSVYKSYCAVLAEDMMREERRAALGKGKLDPVPPPPAEEMSPEQSRQERRKFLKLALKYAGGSMIIVILISLVISLV